MPESKADLLASANEAAGLVQKVFFTYLLVSIYLAILIGSTTHEQLLRASGVQLPLFGVPLSIFWVYAVAPWLYLALHVNLLVQHYLLSRKLHAFNRALELPAKDGQPLSIDGQQSWRIRLYPSIFAQILAGGERVYFKRLVLRSTVFLTVAVAPVALLIWMQIQFLPYHSEWVTWGNRFALIFDLGLLWYYWPLMMSGRDSGWRQIVAHERPLVQSGVCVMLSILVIFASWVLAVVPGGWWERLALTRTADDWWRVRQNALALPTVCKSDDLAQPREIRSLSRVGEISTFDNIRWLLPMRHLDVRGQTLLDVEPSPELIAALLDQEKAEGKLREQTIGLDLEGRDLRGALLHEANLTKANLSDADLRGAYLACTKLVGADMERALLLDAELTWANLQQAELKEVMMTLPSRQSFHWTGVTSLAKARMIGADLTGRTMETKNLNSVKLQGANLSGVDLKGADMRGARLQGANLSKTILEGAKLEGAHLQGANLQGADLARANLRLADITAANYDSVDMIRAKFSDKNSSETVGNNERLPLAIGDIYCGEKESGEKLVGEVSCVNNEEYTGSLVRLLRDLFCSKENFDPPLSSSEAEALYEALRQRDNEMRRARPNEKKATLKEALKSNSEAPKNSNTSGKTLMETIDGTKGCYGYDVLPESAKSKLNHAAQ
jgi:uncharacterized protein YjbI with pentapeptide repeats